MKVQGTLKASELFAIIALVIGIKLSDMTPAIYAQTGKNGYWLMPFISFIVIMPSVLLLVYLLEKYKNKTLVELNRHILGSKIGSVVSFILFLSTFFALSIDSRNYVDTIGTMYFDESPELILYLIFMTVCAFGAKKGFQAIGSTAWAILPYIKIALFILLFILLKEVIWLRVFPIFGDGLKGIVIEGAKKGSVFGDLFVIATAYPLFKDKKNFRKGYLIGSFFILIELTFFFLMYCTFYDYKSITKVAFPFHEITQYINLGTFFTNIETFFMAFWVLCALFRFVSLLYITTWLFGDIFNIKEFEPLVFIVALIAITVGIIPDGPIYDNIARRENFLDVVTPFLVVFPMVLWIVAKFKGELRKE
ncbi:GerAB/ArcD/ProY family transporter [Peribacillus asahii]|uniref:GerAB/ArcD/ProY family transporter n=1 Tax=Peribacillus asahii TaxID=228899 RepID=UPI0037FB6342